MEGLRLEDVRRALDTRDPSLVDMVVSLAGQSDPQYTDLPEEAYTIREFRSEVGGWGFRFKDADEQRQIRIEGWARLESDDADAPLPDRYQLHEIVEALHEAKGAFARETLLEVIRRAPIKWGAWRGLKRLFKETESSGDLELYGALLARIDSELSNTWGDWGEVSRRTLLYLARRGWRFLRRRGESFPAAYVDAAVAVLREYPENTSWNRTWVANHIFYHEYELHGGRCYGQSSFRFWRAPDSLTEHRAFVELWREDPRRLFGLLERARSEQARAFAIEGLKSDFRAELRELDTDNVLRLIQVDSGTVHEFAVWLLENAPRFERAAFRELGLHDAVLSLLDSPGGAARAYAVNYAQTHARDLSVEDLLRLANHFDDEVRKLGRELLEDHDPRKDVGLDAWGRLLGTEHAHTFAVSVLNQHFGASELTLDWFRERFLSDNWQVVSFAVERFGAVHGLESVDPIYYVELIDAEEPSTQTVRFASGCLDRFELSELDVEIFKRLLLHPEISYDVQQWIRQDRLDPVAMGVDYWRALAFRPSWEASRWAREFATNGPPWARGYTWDRASVCGTARAILGDVRNYTPGEIGVGWLMEIVSHTDEFARHWATDYMFEAFAPRDFAPPEATDTLAGCESLWEMGVGEGASDGPIATFARQYLRRHHDVIGEKITGKPVEEERRLPEAFLTFERFEPLLTDTRIAVRRFALEIARSEMARWSPSLDAIVRLCETRRSDVRQLFADALLADENKETARLRIPPAAMEPAGVYRFCESLDRGTRSIGMELIDRYPQFADPASLFRLTDSPDRRVRGFVIKTVWKLYRDHGVTETWEPQKLDAKYTTRQDAKFEQGPGVAPKPDAPPAGPDALRDFLRRVLFGIPPSRPPRGEERGPGEPPPIPARRAKLYLLEVMRDLALEDRAFAAVVTPLLQEFVRTLGKSERGACLVALARLEQRWEVEND